MIVLDTETTGLVLPGVPDLKAQPRIIEIAAVSWCGGEVGRKVATLVNPGVKIPDEITKITGITTTMLAGAPEFPLVVSDLVELFRADPDNTLVAHNLQFDLDMLIFELRAIGWEHRFPYLRHQRDTVAESGNKRLVKWHAELTGAERPQSHRALDDVMMLIECLTLSNQKETRP